MPVFSAHDLLVLAAWVVIGPGVTWSPPVTASTWSLRGGRGRAAVHRGRAPGRLRLEQSTAYPGGILELVYAPA